MSFSIIDKFIFIVFFCFISCHDDYPFDNQSHVSFFDLEKGKVKNVQILAERSEVIDGKYGVFERTDLKEIENPLNIFCCKYSDSSFSFPFRKIENINMYYIPLKYVRNSGVRNSDILISFDNKGNMLEYTVYDKNVLTYNADFQYENDLLKVLNHESRSYKIRDLSDDYNYFDYSKFNDWDRTGAYDTEITYWRLDFEYKGNYIVKSIEQILNEDIDIEPVITEYKYRRYDNLLVTAIAKHSYVDSCYLYLDGKCPSKAIYYDGDKKYNVLIKDNKVYSVLPKDSYTDIEYDNFGNMVKYGKYNIEYDNSGLPKRIIYNVHKKLNVVYNCEYIYDDKGNWIQVNVTPEDRLGYDRTISLINDIKRYIKHFDFKADKSVEDYFDLAHKKADLYSLENYSKPKYEYLYSKFILYRKVNYYN